VSTDRAMATCDDEEVGERHLACANCGTGRRIVHASHWSCRRSLRASYAARISCLLYGVGAVTSKLGTEVHPSTARGGAFPSRAPCCRSRMELFLYLSPPEIYSRRSNFRGVTKGALPDRPSPYRTDRDPPSVLPSMATASLLRISISPVRRQFPVVHAAPPCGTILSTASNVRTNVEFVISSLSRGGRNLASILSPTTTTTRDLVWCLWSLRHQPPLIPSLHGRLSVECKACHSIGG